MSNKSLRNLLQLNLKINQEKKTTNLIDKRDLSTQTHKQNQVKTRKQKEFTESLRKKTIYN